jgi:hypothetical protein
MNNVDPPNNSTEPVDSLEAANTDNNPGEQNRTTQSSPDESSTTKNKLPKRFPKKKYSYIIWSCFYFSDRCYLGAIRNKQKQNDS